MKYKRWKKVRKACCAMAIAGLLIGSAACSGTRAVNGAWWDTHFNVNYDCAAHPDQPGCVDTMGGEGGSGNGSGCTG